MKPTASPVPENVIYSLIDYVSQPLVMIVAAPFLLKTLGTQQYGTWMLINSIAAAASGLGGGFGDGATRYVSMYRGRADSPGAVRSLAAVLIVNCTLGLLSAALMVLTAPLLIGHLFPVEPALRHAAIVALRLSAFVLVLRFAESVFVAAVRGCERYRPAVVVAVIARTAATLSAVGLAASGLGLVAILWSALAVAVWSCAAQGWLAHSVLEAAGTWLHVDIVAGIREVFRFGAFTWLKSTLGVCLAYGDRLIVAALLGTGPLAFYALCSQLTQPLPALIASGFNFLFPNLSAQVSAGRWRETYGSYRFANLVGTGIVVIISIPMIAGAHLILRLWLGAAYGQQYHALLVTMIIANGLLAATIVPHYAALALGRAQALAFVSLAAGVVSLGGGYLLIRRYGLVGGGLAKIVAAVVFLSLFGVVRAAFRRARPAIPSTQCSATPALV